MNKDENMMNGGQQPETPIIIIERDEEEPVAKKDEKKPTIKRKWINIALSIAGIRSRSKAF